MVPLGNVVLCMKSLLLLVLFFQGADLTFKVALLKGIKQTEV
jgi:hypothetical protein